MLYNCKEAETMFSMREVATAVGVKTHQIAYAHLEGYLPEVQRVLGHRVYTETDLEMVRTYFQTRPKTGRGISSREQGGAR
jgi:DNA-binding transcriptional MerR regulator